MPVLTLEQKNERKRARQRARRKARDADQALSLAYAPIEEWDEEELARGRPRNPSGGFHGPKPAWVSAKIHEEAIRRFKLINEAELRAVVPEAIATIEYIIQCNDRDRRGRPVIPPSVKLDACKWIVEHLVGKPTQRVEADISVRLQGILANVMVSPETVESTGLRPAIELGQADAEDVDEDWGDQSE